MAAIEEENAMVHFVSAGPGAVDLITVRGKRLLKEADIVIYAGSLVNPALLSLTKKDCRIYNSAHMDLPDVMDVIRKAEAEQKMTVRLHTGDTSVYSTIREQMDELDEAGISYDVTPGVSAFQAAAASLNAELTLPGISQSVILTRGNGRTKVPERESLKSFAEHHATMVLYLSSSLADEVQKELLAGGYEKDTPVNIVYKASWPEEKIIRSNLDEFPERMEEEHITKTALILVGDVLSEAFKKQDAEDTVVKDQKEDKVPRSKLYDPAFSTGVRKGRVQHIWMAACTRNGADQMRSLKDAWEAKAKQEKKEITFELHVKCKSMEENETKSLKLLTKEAFDQSDVMVFFSSTGIAVRSIAPFLKSKMTDPAVLVIDEKGQNCIPLVSGHIGGANEYAKEVEQMIGAHAVVTTATDLEQEFAVDVFAKEHNLVISDMERAKEVSAKVVEKGSLWFYSDLPELFEINDLAPDVHRTGNLANADIVITADKKIIREKMPAIQEETSKEEKGGIGLVLIPRIYDLGVGCRKNASTEDIRHLIDEILDRLNTVPEAIHDVGSIDLKRDEPAFSWIGQTYHVTPKFFTAKELEQVPGEFTPSAFVKKITGVDNVCERSAVKLSGGKLVVRKTVYGNATAAAARRSFI